MADRTVTVRLRAVVDDYKKAMAGAGKATADVAKSADKWRNLGQSTAALGDQLTRNLTLPILAVGAAATKMSLDFDSVFQQMHQLAGVSAAEIDGMKESVLGLAGETGKAPQELAEALYFLRSSGLEGAAAMDALEMSAKASAAGLGSTAQIADAVSSAMNAYAQSGLSAAEATDVLVATAEAGKAEPAELAAQMGRVLPIASELGITFQDVGAGLAALSLSGNDAAAATTQLQNLMSKLLRPSQQAQERLAEVGISLDDIRGMIEERGLLGTLETLRASLGDAGFTAFLEDVQAVQAGLSLTGENVEHNRQIFEDLANSAGKTDEAFGKWAETMGAQNARAFAELQVALIRLGDIIAPIAADVLGFAADVLSAFSKLPEGAQQAIVAFGAIAAAIGPLLSVGGRAISAVSNVAKAFSSTVDFAGRFVSGFRNADAAASAFSGTAGSLGGKLRGLSVAAGVATAVAGVAVAIEAANDAAVRHDVEDLTQSFLATGDAADQLQSALDGDLHAMNVVDDTFNDLLDTNLAAAERFADAAEAAGFSAEQIDYMRQKIEEKQEADRQAAADQEANTAAVQEGAAAYDEETTAVNETVQALQDYADQIAAMADPLFGLESALQGNRDAMAEVRAKELELAAARDSGNPLEVMAAEQALNDARIAAGQSAFDVASAEATLAAALEEQPGLIGNVNLMLDQFVAQGLITEEEARVLAGRFGVLADRVESVPDRAHTNVSESGSGNVIRSARAVEGAVEDIPRSRTTTIRTFTGEAISNLEAVTSRVNDIPRSVTIDIAFRSYGTAELNRARALTGRGGAGGMIVPGYYAKGGVPMRGPKGTDTVPAWLTPGEMVLNDQQQAQLWAMANGNWRPAGQAGGYAYAPTFHLSFAGAVIGSESEAARWVAKALRKAGEDGLALTVRGRRL